MRRTLILSLLGFALASAASAQTAGRITGTVKDPDGKPIKGATVRATNEAVNAKITSTTDDKGRFAMIGVRTGRWIVVAEALQKAGRYDEAIAAFQSIQSKNTRLTTVNLMLGTLYRDKAAQEKDATAKQTLLNRAIGAYTDL